MIEMRLAMKRLLLVILAAAGLLAVFSAGSVEAQAPTPPTKLTATDRPDDVGDAVLLEWALSPDDTAGHVPRLVLSYNIYRKEASAPDSEFERVGDATYESTTYTDPNAERGKAYVYRVSAVAPDGITESTFSNVSDEITPTMQFFVTTKLWFGIILLIVAGSVVYFIESAKKGKDLKIRKIAGLEAVTEAVGRATEMGRPVLFVPGIQDINDIQTIAGITILGNVARTCAEYDAKIEVPTARSLVMTVARETVESAYLAAGRPDAYVEDNIYYITDEQFGYVAGVTGTMVREKPAACFYMGAFYAESLILAETGHSIGAIQIAGTAMPSQLPFFVAACDYTLIGEEFFAASAYLSGEPHQLGSLKGQDVGKLLAGIIIIVVSLIATLGAVTGNPFFSSIVAFVQNNVMGDQGFLP